MSMMSGTVSAPTVRKVKLIFISYYIIWLAENIPRACKKVHAILNDIALTYIARTYIARYVKSVDVTNTSDQIFITFS